MWAKEREKYDKSRGLVTTPLVCVSTLGNQELVEKSDCNIRTFSSMALESLKSCSIASTSASLGVLVRKRPVIRCMRCIFARRPAMAGGDEDNVEGEREI